MPVSDFLQIVIPKFSEDDASTLANHLEALGHIPIIISKKTRAISLNEGARKTTSDYILFLHADSKIEDDTIENLINYIKARNVDGMYYFSLKFDNGKKTKFYWSKFKEFFVFFALWRPRVLYIKKTFYENRGISRKCKLW